MQKLLLTLPVVLVLLLGALTLALLDRQERLEDRLAALEKRPAAASRAEPAPERVELPPAARLLPPAASAVEIPASAPPAHAEPAADPSFSPAVEQMVKREVERQLKGRSGGFSEVIRMENPVDVMEKELGLSPSQKLRVGDLWKKRDAELTKMFQGGLGEGGILEQGRRIKEVEERYDLEIRRELDFSQQQKYDKLRREGRLHGNVVFQVQIEGKVDDRK